MAPVSRTTVVMDAPWSVAFELGSRVERWPELLPHYRWVRILGRDGESRLAEMAARRGLWPLRWMARVEPKPDERRIYFRHLRGPSRGMRVHWELQEEDGRTRVTIVHEMTLEAPLVRTPLGRWIVTHGFVEPIARRTLACMKQAAEAMEEKETP